MPEKIAYADLSSLLNKELPPSKWFTIDQDLIDSFADATGDHQWIHVDQNRAKAEIGGTIAHGFLTLSLLPVMSQDILEVTGVSRALNYGLDRMRFTGAVPAGSKVRMRMTLVKIEERNGGKLLTRNCIVDVQGADGKIFEKPAMTTHSLGLVFPG